MAYDIGPRIGIDGEAAFRKQLMDINASVKALDAEMRAVTSAYADNEKSVESLTAQDEVLTKTIAQQEKQLELQQKGLKEAAEAYGENDSKTSKWHQAVNETTAALNKNKQQLAQNETALDSLAKGLSETGESAGEAGDGISSFGDLLKAKLTGEAVLNALKKAADVIKEVMTESVAAASEVNALESKYAQTFGDLESRATDAINRVAESTGILSTRLTEAGSDIYAFARSSGGTAVESMDLMETALLAAADSAAYYDRSIEDTTQTLMSFLKGNYANDAALGVSATETTRNAAAMELFGEKYSELSEIQKQQTLLKMVTDSQELSGAMGQASREADEWTNVQGNLNEARKQFEAQLGSTFLPYLTEAAKQATGALEDLTYAMSPEGQNEEWRALLAGQINTLEAVGNEYEDLKQLYTDFFERAGIDFNWTAFEDLSDAVNTARISAITAYPELFELSEEEQALSEKTKAAAEAAEMAAEKRVEESAATESASTAMATALEDLVSSYDASYDAAFKSIDGQIGLFDTMAAESQASIDEMISALDSQLDYLDTYNANLKKAMELGVDEGIIAKLSDGSEKSAGILQEIVNSSGEKITELNEKFAAVEEGKEDFANSIAAMETDFERAMSDIVDDYAQSVGDLDMWDEAFVAGENTIQGLIDGAGSMSEALKAKFTDMAAAAINAYRTEMDIHSPSGVMRQEGVYTVEGLIQGIEDLKPKLTGAIEDVTSASIDAAASQLKDSASELAKAYRSAYESAYKSISGSMDLTQTMTAEAASGIEDITAALGSQLTYVQQYTKDLKQALELGLNKGLLSELSDGSEASAGTLREIVSSGADMVAQLNAAYTAAEAGKEEFAAAIALIDTDLTASAAAASELKSSLAALEESYSKAYDSAYKSITGTTSLFKELSAESAMSIGEMNSALDSQIDYLDKYTSNLQRASELGLDKDLLSELSDGSEKSAGYLQEIVDSGADAIVELNDKFAAVRSGRETFSSTVAALAVDFESSMAEMLGEYSAAVEDMDMYDDAYIAGMSTIDGLLNGIDAQSDLVISRFADMAKASMEAYSAALSSASAVVPDIAGSISNVAAGGIRSQDADLSDLLAGTVNGIQTAVDGMNTGGDYTFNLVLPDGQVLARYELPHLIEVGRANGTPILNPTL